LSKLSSDESHFKYERGNEEQSMQLIKQLSPKQIFAAPIRVLCFFTILEIPWVECVEDF